MGSIRALVHLGPMKTGTSAFAAHLSRRAEAGTLPQHVIYPTGDLWFPSRGHIVKHHDLIELARAPLRRDSGERRRITTVTPTEIRARFDAQAAEARRRGGDVVVVMVCEIADQRAMPALADILAEYFDLVDFVIVAREQSSALRSLFAQQIRMWNRSEVDSLDPHGFVNKHVKQGSYNYATLWDKWNPAPGAPYSMHFVPYRDGGKGTDDLSQDVFSAVGLGPFPHDPDTLTGDRIHSTFSERAMARLASIKRWANRLRVVPGAKAIAERVFVAALKAAHHEANNSTSFQSWSFTAVERASIRAAYRQSNEQFRSKLGKIAREARWKSWFDHVLGDAV